MKHETHVWPFVESILKVYSIDKINFCLKLQLLVTSVYLLPMRVTVIRDSNLEEILPIFSKFSMTLNLIKYLLTIFNIFFYTNSKIYYYSYYH